MKWKFEGLQGKKLTLCSLLQRNFEHFVVTYKANFGLAPTLFSPDVWVAANGFCRECWSSSGSMWRGPLADVGPGRYGGGVSRGNF